MAATARTIAHSTKRKKPMILYSWHKKKFIRKRMAASLTTKATIQPSSSTATSVPVMDTPETANLITLSRDAPAMTGMAK